MHVFPPSTRVDSTEYQYCMSEALVPAISDPEYLFPKGQPKGWIYMQDGAPCHRSNATYAWLEDNLPVHVRINDGAKWPAGSPDLNPIENLWNFCQNAVVEVDPKTVEEFRDCLVDTWWDISQEYIQNLYKGMGRRCEAVINADGKMTKY